MCNVLCLMASVMTLCGLSLAGVLVASVLHRTSVNVFNRPNYLFSTNFSTFTNCDTPPRKTARTQNTFKCDNDNNKSSKYNDKSSSRSTLTHVDHHGNATMVDVGSKSTTYRRAVASGKITLSPKAFKLVRDNQLSKKGSVLGVSQIAGIMAAKQTSSLIPLCHNIPLSKVELSFELCDSECSVKACSSVMCVGVTGVEMEVLTAVSVALLTIYDMTKAVAKDHIISDIQLEEKEGGASGHFART